MKARSTAISGALALVGLVAAYLTWQRPREAVRADVVQVFTATRQSLERVHYEDGTRFVDVQKQGASDPRLWVTLGFLPGKTPSVDAGFRVVSLDGGTTDGGVDAGVMLVAVKAADPVPTRETYANERADTVFARFTPLEATRALGTLETSKLDELGLVGSERKLAVTVAGQVHAFTVSKPLPGVIGTYLQEQPSGEVYLVQGAMFSDLDPQGVMLVDRRLHTFKQGEVDAFTVTFEGKTVDFVQSNADIPQTAKVARAATPDKADEVAKLWHDKVWSRTVVTDVLGKGEAPKLGEPKVVLRIDYKSHGAAKGWLEFGMDPKQGTWARSENTVNWVTVHQGTEETIIEAQRLLQ